MGKGWCGCRYGLAFLDPQKTRTRKHGLQVCCRFVICPKFLKNRLKTFTNIKIFLVNVIVTHFSFKMSLKMLNLVKIWHIYENMCENWCRAFIQPETCTLFSSEYTGFCCRACNESSSGFSVIVNRRTRTVTKDTWELKCEKINSLKTLKVKSGNAAFSGLDIAATVGRNEMANSSQRNWNTKFRRPKNLELL